MEPARGYAGGGSDGGITEKANVNWVGNYAIAGPATPGGSPSTTTFTKDIGGSNLLQLGVYQALNLTDSNHDAVRDGTDTGWNAFRVSDGTPFPVADQRATPFAAPAVTTTGAAAAYNQVLNYVGNYWWSRDSIDQRIISNVQNNTSPPGGIPATAPVPAELAAVQNNPMTTRPAGFDSDGDGMPDAWEVKYGLNPNAAADGKLDFDNDGYTNVQEYLDETGAFPAPAPIVFNGATNTRYAQITNWKTSDGITTGSNWEPTRFDEAQINSGTAVVDAAGQHAGTIKVGAQAGSTGTLNITSGWLDVATEMIVGADPAATGVVNMTGGTLSVPTLSKGGVGSSFNLTGGTLHADTVNFSLANDGGIIAPGANSTQTHVVGDLTLNSGSLALGLVSASSFNSLLVDGTTTLGGALNITTFAGFVPTDGETWQIITASGITGSFSSITSGYSVFKQGNNLAAFVRLRTFTHWRLQRRWRRRRRRLHRLARLVRPDGRELACRRRPQRYGRPRRLRRVGIALRRAQPRQRRGIERRRAGAGECCPLVFGSDRKLLICTASREPFLFSTPDWLSTAARTEPFHAMHFIRKEIKMSATWSSKGICKILALRGQRTIAAVGGRRITHALGYNMSRRRRRERPVARRDSN